MHRGLEARRNRSVQQSRASRLLLDRLDLPLRVLFRGIRLSSPTVTRSAAALRGSAVGRAAVLYDADVIPLVIEDPLPMVRSGLAAALREFGYEHVGEEGGASTSRTLAGRVVLFTLARGGRSLESLDGASEAACVVCLVDDWDVRLVREAMVSGAGGIQLRSAPPEAIAATLDSARAGVVAFPVDVLRDVLAVAVTGPSSQEVEWIQRLADGETVASLARGEAYSERQMFRLLGDLWQRLGVSNRHEAIAKLTQQN